MRVALLVAAAALVCLAQPAEQPRLTLETRQHDFGQLPPDARVTRRFQLSNTGTAPLLISKLTPSCGCTSTVVGRSTVLPGESTQLEVTFNAIGQRGATRKSLQVTSNDPIEPVQTLTFDADVLAEVRLATDEVFFGALTGKDRRKASLKVATGTGQPISLTDVDLSEAPWLGVATRMDGPDLWVDFELLARRLPPGQGSGTDTVALHVMNPRASVVQLKVRWEKRPPLVAKPERVVWAQAAGQALTATVQLQEREHKAFRILSARSTHPDLQVGPLPGKAALRQALTLVLAASAKAGEYNEKVILTLDGPGHPEFEFRVAASLR